MIYPEGTPHPKALLKLRLIDPSEPAVEIGVKVESQMSVYEAMSFLIL